MIDLEAPLVPDPEEADRLLRRELLAPEYHEENLLQQLFRWILRQFESGLDRASSATPLGTLGALLTFLLVLLLIGWLVSRTRRTAQAPAVSGPVLTGERVSAEALRRRAQDALRAGDGRRATVEAFRAIARQQVEAGRLEDLPGTTAREVASTLGALYPDRGQAFAGAAVVFDRALYGEQPVSTDEATRVLELAGALAGSR